MPWLRSLEWQWNRNAQISLERQWHGIDLRRLQRHRMAKGRMQSEEKLMTERRILYDQENR